MAERLTLSLSRRPVNHFSESDHHHPNHTLYFHRSAFCKNFSLGLTIHICSGKRHDTGLSEWNAVMIVQLSSAREIVIALLHGPPTASCMFPIVTCLEAGEEIRDYSGASQD